MSNFIQEFEAWMREKSECRFDCIDDEKREIEYPCTGCGEEINDLDYDWCADCLHTQADEVLAAMKCEAKALQGQRFGVAERMKLQAVQYIIQRMAE